MPENFVVFGLNHRTTPIDLRERCSFSSEEVLATLDGVKRSIGEIEAVVLSTCQRTEIYSCLPGNGHFQHAFDRLIDIVLGAKSCSREQISPHLYVSRDQAAVRHLFRVALGLESTILGEGQILRQVRDAYELAREGKSAGRLFHLLFPAAIKAGRRIRCDTGLGKGNVSDMGAAAVRLAEMRLGDLSGRRLLIIGSGKIAGLAAAAFRKRSLNDFYVVNRSLERAEELVQRICGIPRPFGDLDALLGDVDVVISSTSSPQPIVRADDLEAILGRRCGRPLVVIDLAVPRDFEPRAGSLPGIHLFHVDDLEQVANEASGERAALIRRFEMLLEEELRGFYRRMNWLHLDPVISHLMQRFEELRSGELEKLIGGLPPDYHPLVERFSMNLMKKFLHFPIEKLKSLRDGDGLGPDEIAFIQKLFLNGSSSSTVLAAGGPGRATAP